MFFVLPSLFLSLVLSLLSREMNSPAVAAATAVAATAVAATVVCVCVNEICNM